MLCSPLDYNKELLKGLAVKTCFHAIALPMTCILIVGDGEWRRLANTPSNTTKVSLEAAKF